MTVMFLLFFRVGAKIIISIVIYTESSLTLNRKSNTSGPYVSAIITGSIIHSSSFWNLMLKERWKISSNVKEQA